MSRSNKNSSKSVFSNVYRQPYATYSSRIKLYSATKGSRDFVQRLGLLKKLAIHSGCVNCISWSDDGRLLLSGSDDQHLIVSNAYNHKILTDYKTSHRANIFCAKFLPCTSDTHIVSCAGDGMILFSDVTRLNETHQNIFNCHSGTTYKLVTIPNDPYSFLSCGEDFTVRCFDLRTKQKCSKHQCTEDVLINCGRAVTALAVNPWAPYQFAVGSADSTVRLYDGRMLNSKPEVEDSSSPNYLCSFTVPALSHGAYRITSLAFSPEGEELLASYSAEYLYLFNIKNYDKCELHSNSARVSPQTRRANSHNAATQSNFPAVRRLRLRGDWSDTGPDARPEQEFNSNSESSPARRSLHAIFMRRMTNAIFRIFNSSVNRGGSEEGNQDINTAEEQEDVEQMRNENESEAGEGNSAVSENTLNISISESQSSDTDSSTSSPSSCQRNETQTSSSSSSASHSGLTNVQLPSFEQTYSSLVKQPKSSQSSSSIPQHPPSPSNCSSESHSMDTEDTVNPSMSLSSAANVIAASQPSTSFNTKSPCLAACEPSRVLSATTSQGRTSVATQTEFQLNSATTAVTESSFTLASFLSNVPQILSTSNYLRQTDDAISSLIQNNVRHNSQNASPTSAALDVSVSQSSLSNVQASSSEGSAASHSQEATNVSLENCDSTSNISNDPSCKSDNLNDPTKLVSNSGSERTCQNVPASKLMPCSSFEAEPSSVAKSDNLKNEPVESVQCNTGVNETSCSESLNFNSVKVQIDAISCQVSDKSAGLVAENEDMNDPSSSSSCSSSCSDSRIDSVSCDREVQSFIKKNKFAANKLQNNSFDASKTCSENLVQGISTNLGSFNQSSAKNDQATSPISDASCINASMNINAQNHSSSPSSHKKTEIIFKDDKSSNTPEQFSDQPVLPSRSLSSKPQNPNVSVDLSGHEDDNDRDDDLAELLDSHSPNVNDSKQKSAKSPIHSSCESICESNNFDYEHENDVEENEYPFITQKYTGHRNARTMIKEATFWGNDHVLSGSDCGHVFIWDRWTAKLTMLLQADNHVVNCIQPHPFQPILATSGIDYDVKLWAPINEESAFDEEKAQELMQRNIIMLEETKDTITVPASFALRMLAFLSQMRRGRRSFPNEPDQ